MKKLLTIAIIFFSIDLFGQSEFHIMTIQEQDSIVMEIRDKDTVIYDTMGTIRYLLKMYNEINNENIKYQNDLFKARQLLESVNSIMFFKPNQNTKYFKL